MSVAVLIPWRDIGCDHRARALAAMLARHAVNGWPVVIGRGDDTGPWVKASAVADAVAQTTADVFVIADADVWTDHLPAAVEAVCDEALWAVPHRGVHRLNEAGTGRWLAGEPLDTLDLVERPYMGVEGGGIVVIRRDVYEDCPLDSRFIGWGSEDESFGMALRALHGPPWRPLGHSPLVHAFHPPQERARRSFGCEASRDLRKQYARARASGEPDAMRRLVKEAKAPCP